MGQQKQGIANPTGHAAHRQQPARSPADSPADSPAGEAAASRWAWPSIHRESDQAYDYFPHDSFPDPSRPGPISGGLLPATEGTIPASLLDWMGPANIERRLSDRAELLWRQLAGGRTMPDSEKMPELLRPPFLANSMLVETAARGATRIAFIGETLGTVTGLRVDSPAPSARPADLPIDQSPSAFGARLVRLATKAARAGVPCRYESDLSDIEQAASGSREQILTRAIALPFVAAAAARTEVTLYSIVVVASWR